MSVAGVVESKDHHKHKDHQHQNNSDEFNPHVLFEWFNSSLIKTDPSLKDFNDVSLDEYLKAYEEINKFLSCLGTIFYFVISDVKEKIKIVGDYIASDPVNYRSILSMVEYEKSKRLLSSPEAASAKNATRNILRLHRALLFIYKFLDGLIVADPKCKTPQLCTEIYQNTLGKHHGWLVRKAAVLGMYSLPKREILVGYMGYKNEADLAKFSGFIKIVEQVYNITESIYEKNKILDLP